MAEDKDRPGANLKRCSLRKLFETQHKAHLDSEEASAASKLQLAPKVTKLEALADNVVYAWAPAPCVADASGAPGVPWVAPPAPVPPPVAAAGQHELELEAAVLRWLKVEKHMKSI